LAGKISFLKSDIPVGTALPFVVLGIFWLFSFATLEPALVWLAHLPQILHHAGRNGPRPYNPDDYLMFWAAGHLAASNTPADAYIRHALAAWESAHSPGHVFGDPFVYPPLTMLLTQPLAWVGYWPGFLLWTSAITASAILILRRAGLPWPVIVTGCLGPAVVLGIAIGQISLLACALSIAALLRLETTPIRSGVLMGLAAVKPQDGLVVPFAMLARQRYRPIMAGFLTILIMGGIATLLFGPEIWVAYWHHGAKTADNLLAVHVPRPTAKGRHGLYTNFFVSVFWMLREEHVPLIVSLVAQAVAACCAIAVVFRAWRKPVANPLARIALTVFLGSFLTPYAFTHDLAGYTFMIAALAWQQRRLDATDVLLFAWPGYSPFITGLLHVAPTPLVIAYAARRAWNVMHKLPETASAHDSSNVDLIQN
jgi:hypothetical protein